MWWKHKMCATNWSTLEIGNGNFLPRGLGKKFKNSFSVEDQSLFFDLAHAVKIRTKECLLVIHLFFKKMK